MNKDEIRKLIEDSILFSRPKDSATSVYDALESAGCLIKDKEPTQATSELLRDANEIIESGRKSICYCDEKFICKPCEWLTKYEEVVK